MIAAAKPANEEERLLSLKLMRILDTEAEPIFDDLAELAAHTLRTPIALLSLVDENRQWFKARRNFSEKETPRDLAFCAHAILRPEPLVVNDATQDPRFVDHPLVTGKPGVRFYAGAPLLTPDGHALGTLCVLDTKPRRPSQRQIESLARLARQAVGQMQLRRDLLRRTDELGSLDSSSGLLRSLFESSPMMIGLIEFDGEKLVHVFDNPATARFYGTEPYGTTGRDLASLGLDEDQVNHWKEQAIHARNRGRPSKFSFRRGEGVGCRWVRATVHYLGKRANGYDFFSFVGEDVTERRRLERALEKERERFHLAIEGANAGLWDWDIQKNEVFHSPRWITMLGFEYGELPRGVEGWKSLLHPEDVATAEKAISDYMAGITPTYQLEHRMRCKDGKYRWLLSKGTCVRAPDGTPMRLTGWLVDIHDLKSTVEELQLRDQIIREQQVKIINSAKMSSLGEMAGGIAHEINNPLAIIAMALAQLEETLGPDREKAGVRENIHRIESTVERIGKIVKGLRLFSRNGDKDPFHPVSLLQVAQETVALCWERFRTANVKLEIEIPADLTVECRAVQISQVFLNLLSNAFDAVAGTPGAWVKVTAVAGVDGAQVRVEDSGPGIPPGVASRMMEPFFTTKDVGQGTGLGLAISSGILEDHGTTLTYNPASAHTRLDFCLPYRQKA